MKQRSARFLLVLLLSIATSPAEPSSDEDGPTLPSGVKLGLVFRIAAMEVLLAKIEDPHFAQRIVGPQVRILSYLEFGREFMWDPPPANRGLRVGAAQPSSRAGQPARVLLRDVGKALTDNPISAWETRSESEHKLRESDWYNPPPMLALVNGTTNQISGWPILVATPVVDWSNHLITLDCTVSYHEFLGYEEVAKVGAGVAPSTNTATTVDLPRVKPHTERFKANLWGGQTMAITLQSIRVSNPVCAGVRALG